MSNKSDVVHLRIEPATKAEALKRAHEEGRTLSNLILRALEKYLAEGKTSRK